MTQKAFKEEMKVLTLPILWDTNETKYLDSLGVDSKYEDLEIRDVDFLNINFLYENRHYETPHTCVGSNGEVFICTMPKHEILKLL